MKGTLVLAVILTAVVDPVLAQVACPNPVPDEPTRAQIVACLGAISALQTQITDANAKIDSLAELPKPTKGDPGPPGPRGEPGLPGLPRTAHRVGPSGVIDPDNEDFLDFTVTSPGATQTRIIERSEQFAFCALSSFRTSAKVVETAGYLNCTVSREPTNPRWQVTLNSYSICRVMCLR
jgi:hypothetical protein